MVASPGNQAANQEFDSAERYLETAKSIAGPEHPFIRTLELMLAQLRWDIDTAEAIGKEFVQRSEKEYVPFFPTPWNDEDTVKMLRRSVQQNQWSAMQFLLQPNKPNQFTDVEWQALRDAMNIAELEAFDLSE